MLNTRAQLKRGFQDCWSTKGKEDKNYLRLCWVHTIIIYQTLPHQSVSIDSVSTALLAYLFWASRKLPTDLTTTKLRYHVGGKGGFLFR